MRTRGSTATRTPTSGPTRRRGLATAATMLPLALGLAGNMSTPGASTQARHGGGGGGAPTAISCTLPFDATKRHHAIDDSCSAQGNASTDDPKQAARAEQNEAKNNFCATSATVNIDFDVLHQLQQDAAKPGSAITFGSDAQIPKNRSVLRGLPTKAGPLSEGAVVRLVAFVIDAHPSNLGKGESVNCNQPDAESNDIHIVLGQNSNRDDECTSVTAEMSPHFRPDTWTPNNLNQNNAHLFRFTGQLFFDASHRPCSGGTGSPKRSSLWEIHPVYAVDVCGDISNDCKVDSDQNWIPLSDFVGTGASDSESRLSDPDWIDGPNFKGRTNAPHL